MRIAITGKQGQLVRAFTEMAAVRSVEVVRLGRPEVDLTNPSRIEHALGAAKADVVINAAAYTAVDQAESEPEAAMAINAQGAEAIALAAARLGRPVVQISTDYVFNGRLRRPYVEDDAADPINVYGRTELAGERAVATANTRHAVLRTAWLYSPFGRNFVMTMLRLGEEQARVPVVADQFGNPTSAFDVADILISMATRITQAPEDMSLYGTFHAAGHGDATWANLAEAVFAEAESRGRARVTVEPITASQYPTTAERPADSRLDISKLSRVYNASLPHWRHSLKSCVARILAT